MKLIDADALLAEYDRLHVGEPGRARKMIEDAPEAIIRCKDCIHDNDCAIQDIAQTGFNFFCGCAERRTDE